MGSNPPSVDNWVSIVSFNGTVNVGKVGSFTFGGSYISRWGKVSHIDTLNINGGIVSVMADSGNTSYFLRRKYGKRIKNECFCRQFILDVRV